jgi:hypothetical protein
MRALLAALSLSAAVPGAWATAAPRSFYGDFPGSGHHWVSLLPGYNAHLVSDAGAFYLAFALMLAWAAVHGGRQPALTVSAGFALFSAIHLAWHATHLGGFPTTDAVEPGAQARAAAQRIAGAPRENPERDVDHEPERPEQAPQSEKLQPHRSAALVHELRQERHEEQDHLGIGEVVEP